MDANLKARLVRIAEIGRLLIDGENDRIFGSMLEDLGNELFKLSGVCELCDGSGVHPGENPEDFDGETPLERCPGCFGTGFDEPQ
ncbi:hypothetical protein QCD61_28325 (plasmid) [Pseudomonas viciae]|uniref:Molecular chaperone DnaJ n=1 Tax=Pseudomonas viciae TaxID=2505979 RepID=A0ABY8PMI0_9PSED|nr:hypothetical protein [Pseudomonas viciae]WGO96406.1 hypothetical protein QCD61_28325 [Pseudomonas viciae]